MMVTDIGTDENDTAGQENEREGKDLIGRKYKWWDGVREGKGEKYENDAVIIRLIKDIVILMMNRMIYMIAERI